MPPIGVRAGAGVAVVVAGTEVGMADGAFGCEGIAVIGVSIGLAGCTPGVVRLYLFGQGFASHTL